MKANNHLSFADRLKALRVERGLTQKQLSEVTGIGYGTIVNYENRQREPNSKNMACLEEYFNVSGAYLRGETDDPAPNLWESPSTLDELKKIDVSLLPGLLESYQKASPETQFYVRGALAYIANALHVEDAEFQRRATYLLEHFCNIAYDFVRNYHQEAQRSEEGQKIDFAKAYNFYMKLLSADLVDTQQYYFPSSPDPRQRDDGTLDERGF